MQAHLRRAHQSVAVLFFVCGFGFSNWLSRIPTVREDLHLSDRNLGILLLFTGIGSMVAFRMAGSLIHKYGSRAVSIFGTALFCVTLVGPPAARNVYIEGLMLLLLGFFAGFMDVGMNTQAVEVERQKRYAILSTLHGICSLGSLAGAGTGALAAFWGISPTWHLLTISLPLLAATLWSGAGLLPATEIKEATRGSRPQGLLLVLGAIGFCSSVGEGAMADWIGVYLKEDLATTIGIAGLGYAFFSLTMVMGRFSCDSLAGYVQPRQMVRWSGLTVIVGLVAGLMINTPWAMMAASLAVGLGLAPIIPAILRAGGQIPHVPPSQALATLATMSYGGFLFGPPSIGLVAEYTGLRLALGLVVVLAAVLTLLAQWMPKPSHKLRPPGEAEAALTMAH